MSRTVDPSKPKRPTCSRCKTGRHLKPIMYRPYNNKEALVVPLWHCSHCDYNTGSEMILSLDGHSWDTKCTYEELLGVSLSNGSKA